MGRSSHRKKDRKITQHAAIEMAAIDKPIKAKSWLMITWNKISLTWKIAGVLFLLGSGVLTFVQLYDRFSPPIVEKKQPETQKDRFKKENIDTGFLNGPVVFKNYIPEPFTSPILTKEIINMPPVKGILIRDFANRGVKLKIGTNIFSFDISQLYNGVTVSSLSYSYCPNINIFFGVKNDRLYVSVKFKDIYTDQPIGFIEFNKWKLFLPNLIDYDNDDQRLEVRDKNGFIVFSLQYQENFNDKTPIVNVYGYFIIETSILVLNDDVVYPESCIDKKNANWKQAAIKKIEKTKSIF